MKKIIVDTNVWPAVFVKKNKDHAKYSSVLEAIMDGKRLLCWGGSTYKRELLKCPQYLSFHAELARTRKGSEFCTATIDKYEKKVKSIEKDKDFDDPHLISIEVCCKTGLIVTADKRSHRFIKSKNLYPKYFRIPKIYSKSVDLA